MVDTGPGVRQELERIQALYFLHRTTSLLVATEGVVSTDYKTDLRGAALLSITSTIYNTDNEQELKWAQKKKMVSDREYEEHHQAHGL